MNWSIVWFITVLSGTWSPKALNKDKKDIHIYVYVKIRLTKQILKDN